MLQNENTESFTIVFRNPLMQLLMFSFVLLTVSSCANHYHITQKDKEIKPSQTPSPDSSLSQTLSTEEEATQSLSSQSASETTASQTTQHPPASAEDTQEASAEDTQETSAEKKPIQWQDVDSSHAESSAPPISEEPIVTLMMKQSDKDKVTLADTLKPQVNAKKNDPKVEYVSDILEVQGVQYSGKMKGYVTLSGEAYRSKALKIAHATLPLGQKVELIDSKAGESVEVVVNDRPNSDSGHDFLMTPRVAKKLGIKKGEVRPLTIVVKKENDRVAKAKATGKTLVGYASYYADYFHGRQTANGENFNMHALTAAHRDLPLGTWVRVTNLINGKQVDVRINDRGPFKDPKKRIIDLSLAAAKEIKMRQKGVVRVKVEILDKKS